MLFGCVWGLLFTMFGFGVSVVCFCFACLDLLLFIVGLVRVGLLLFAMMGYCGCAFDLICCGFMLRLVIVFVVLDLLVVVLVVLMFAVFAC